ncbi:MAG: flagellar basal body rod protein FlgB [Sulfurimonas sp.]|jgi:flagellar basal-body rod protein FlgB|nr:flagellar basal body rod protein FlgB [Sulfurimonadaceae bacterium]
MALEISANHKLATVALDYRSLRQDLISSNIANIDTPYYRPRDIAFEDALAAAKNQKPDTSLKMAKTSSMHLDPLKSDSAMSAKLFFRDGHLARNDANSVDLDVETTQMSKNSIMYNALINAIKKEEAIYKSVIDSSSKVS